jgi:hypothetical protein
MREWTPPVDLLYLTLRNDIGRRWSWKNGVLMGAGISIGAAFQMDKLNLTPVEADEKVSFRKESYLLQLTGQPDLYCSKPLCA